MMGTQYGTLIDVSWSLNKFRPKLRHRIRIVVRSGSNKRVHRGAASGVSKILSVLRAMPGDARR